MSSLVRLALRFRAVTLLLVVLLAGGGGYAAVSLNQELFPSLEVPYLVVAATQPTFSAVYLLAALALFYRHRSQLRSLLRDGFRTSYQEMTAETAMR